MERGAERFAGMVVVPDASGGLVRWLVGRAIDPDRMPRFQALPGPKPVLGMGRLGPAPSWTVVTEGVFDWLALAQWGLPAVAALGTQGVERVAAALRGCPRVFLAFDADDAGREATERLLTLLGRRAAAVTLPQGVGDVADLAALPHGRDHLPAPALAGRPFRPLAAFPLSTPHPLTELASLRSLPYGTRSRFSHPLSPPRRTYAQCTTGSARTTDSHRACPVLDTGGVRTGHSLQEHTTQTEGDRHGEQERKQQRPQQRDRHRPRPRQRQWAQARRRNRQRARAALGRAARPPSRGALGQPLDPALVSQRKGRAGRTYDYLEGHAVIDQANRIFGFGGWGYELAGDVTLRQIENVDTKTGKVKTTSFYSAPVRVTVPGAPPRTDIGFNAVAEDNADGHETAIKGAVTDGMKRALRSFGVQFGNGFYGDQPAEEAAGRRTAARQTGRASGGNTRTQRAPAPARTASGPDNVPALRKRLIEVAVEQGFDEDGVRTAVKNKTGKDLDALTAAELAPLVEAAAKKLQETQQAKAT